MRAPGRRASPQVDAAESDRAHGSVAGPPLAVGERGARIGDSGTRGMMSISARKDPKGVEAGIFMRLMPSPMARGLLLAVIAGIFFQCLNATVKMLVAELPPLFVAWGRWTAGLLMIAPFLLAGAGLAAVRTDQIHLHALRAGFHTTGYVLWYLAVGLIPLAEAAALGFSGPIFVAIGAALFLGETVRARRWVAVVVGFVGVLIIVRPGFGTLNWGTLLMLASVPVIAGSNLVAKKLTGRDDPKVIVFWQSVLATVCFLPFALLDWRVPTVPQLAWLVLAGVFGQLGYLFMTSAYRLADISAVQPTVFLGIVWAAAFDYFLFGRNADLATFAGAAIILASTSIIAHREAAAARQGKR
ncbi:DMT family transporter [Reyranella sp. CPCC 100927]|nr:DMT family transporter [Reyranella sp. CPCC 100927]